MLGRDSELVVAMRHSQTLCSLSETELAVEAELLEHSIAVGGRIPVDAQVAASGRKSTDD